ncbi:META domain-containing protein [Solitalea canadensis]|uniref:Heat shock protein n=1 Tax=Solitalea canadensis (strain ATCC 29591 / DSM 3403 / JCM 21819 / LMG 8368 / NBRC 15130 / NCIMB 12057 / USAM 9D) TaxID=929556 RepID=H8KQY4_SOLCM|nr:META domain-containing protein [Solitalea canadensis]AFD07130.1 heat shock protein [Solitalea canadensis DSM 3403]
MKVKFTLVAMFAIFAFLGFGCNTMKSSGLVTPENVNQLVGSKWNLSQLMSNGSAIDISKGKPAFIEFNKDDSRVSGSLGCNNFTGGYKFEEGKLKFGPLASTKMMCTEMAVEDALSKALNDATDVKLNGEKLQLFKGSDLLASFTK